MAALNFPTTGLVAGVTQYSANGTTYLWDGVKWVGRTAGGAAGTNSIQNNGHTVQVRSDGALILSEGSVFADLAWTTPESLATNDVAVIPPQGGATNITGSGDNGGAQLFWSQWAEPVDASVLQDGIPSMAFNWAFLNRDGFSVENYPAGTGSTNYKWNFGNDGALKFPNVDTSGAQIAPVTGGISFGTDTGDVNIWPGDKQFKFDASGVLTLPAGGDIKDSTGQTVLGGTGGGYNGGNIVSTAGPAITFSKIFETNEEGQHLQLENIAFVGNVLALDAGHTQAGPGYVPSMAWNMSTLLGTWSANGAVAGEQSIFNAPHSDSGNIGMISFAGNTGYGSVFWSGDHESKDIAGQYITSTGNVVVRADSQNWVFTPDGILSMPTTTTLNSGGIGVPNSAEIGTSVAFDGPDIGISEVFMGSGYGEFRSIYSKTSPLDSGLVYAGVEGFNYTQRGDVNFAGMVSQTPNIDSMYALRLNEQGQIVIGFTQEGQSQVSTDWSVVVGTLTTDYTVNGLFANTARTVISSSGTNGIELTTNRGTVLFGNRPEHPTVSSHWHIMPADPSATDLFFGNDTNYVKLPRGTGNVVVGAEGPEWTFDSDGNLTLPVVSFGLSGSPAVGPTIHFPVIDSGTPVAGGSLSAVANGPNGSFVGMSLTSNNYSWTFQTDGTLIVPDNGIAFGESSFIRNRNEEGLILWQNDNSELNNNEYVGLWYGGDVVDHDSPNVSITAGSYNWATDDGSTYNNSEFGTLEFFHYPDAGSSQGLRQINLDIVQTSGNILNWHFDESGNLYLPADPAVSSVSGIVFGDGTVQTTAATGGGNGTANRVQFANAGSITQAQDAEPGRYNIVIDAEKDVVINTDEEGQQFRFTSTGNLKLSRNSIISDKDESLDIVVDRPSQSSYWYNIFGYTGAVIDSNTAINGSVCHDTGGNVYALGSVYGTVSSDNLFMKFSPEGELLWRRTWTDTHGNPCGSYNSSMRFIAANVALGTQDTILWAAFVGWEDHTSYVGTMDTDGNMVDEFGNPRLATRLKGIKVTDVEWAGNVESFNSAVYAVGNYRAPGYNYIPCVYGVDLDTSSVFVDSTVSPAGVNLAFGSISNDPWTNTFNATVPIPTIPSGLASIGTYFDGDFHHAMVTFLEQGPPASIAIGTANHGEEDIYGEDICCDANGNVYVIVNNVSNNYAVVIKGNATSLAAGSSIWQIVIGTPENPDKFYATSIAYYHNHVYVLGQYRNNATSNVDVVLVKINEYTGIVWQRVIGTPGTEGLAFYGPKGLESTSGIHVKDGLIAIAFTTSDHSVTGLNTITLQYPIDGSVLGTFGDFYINEFDAGHSTMDYSIVELTVGYNSASTTTAVATLNPTVQTVGTGWTSIQWDLDNNRQVYGPQTFKFTADGMFDTAEITHEGEVRITAAVAPDVIELTPSTWAFQNNDGLRFPDGSVQYGAYVEQETALDGGSAVSVYNIVPRPLVADGGGSSSRHGVTDPVYDGSSGNDYVLDGGGA